MIFAAGYNLRRRTFFRYFLYIFIFGIVGTFCSFSFIAPLTYLTNRVGLFKYTFKQNVTDNGTIIPPSPKPSPKPTPNKEKTLNFLFTQEYMKNVNKTNTTCISKNIEENQFGSRILDKQEKDIKDNYAKILEKDLEKDADPYALNFSLSEILLFSSVITATDTVAALTFVSEASEPKLFSILLGEGVVNDAVCIVLYGIIQNLSKSDSGKMCV